MTTFTGLIGKKPLLSYVDPFPGLLGTDKRCGPCPRCGGSGEFGPRCVYNGRCFQCHGSGNWNYNVSTHRRWARQEAYQRDYAEEIAAKQHELREAEIAHAQLVNDWLEAEAAHKEAERLAGLVQGFIGEVGDRVSGIEVSIKVAKYIAGSYNRSSSMFVIAEDADGHVIKFFGSARSVMNLERGDKAVITTGRIREHAEYLGQEQTVLSHVKVEIQETEIDEAA